MYVWQQKKRREKFTAEFELTKVERFEREKELWNNLNILAIKTTNNRWINHVVLKFCFFNHFLWPNQKFTTRFSFKRFWFTNQTKQNKTRIDKKISDDEKQTEKIALYISSLCIMPISNCTEIVPILLYLSHFDQKLSPIYLCNRRIHIFSIWKFYLNWKHAC